MFIHALAKLLRAGSLAIVISGLSIVGCHKSTESVIDPVIQPSASAVVSTLAGSGACGFANGPASAARFNTLTSVVVDALGNIYVADYSDSRIRKIDTGGNVTTYAGNGQYGFADGPAATARFDSPASIAVDAAGNVFVADAGNSRIRKIDTGGNVSTLAGSGVLGFADGPAATAQFYGAGGVAVDFLGNVYVADKGNHRIRKISTNGNVTTLAGSGQFGFTDGPAATARFHYPSKVAVDAAGNVYVADGINCRIRKIDAVGNVSTLAGSGELGFADGPATTAQFHAPGGMAVDFLGNVYVADMGNHRIRKISTTGNVTTYAGSGMYGFADGPSATAQFHRPTSVAVDAAGNLYVADENNFRIRKITPL